MKTFIQKNRRKQKYSISETQNIDRKLYDFLESKLGEVKDSIWVESANKNNIKKVNKIGIQDNIDIDDISSDEDTFDTSTEQKINKSKQSKFDEYEQEDLDILYKFWRKMKTLKSFIQFFWRKILTVDMINTVLNHIFDYQWLQLLHSDDRFLFWVKQMLQIVKMLSNFIKLSTNEIYKYWWQKVKHKISEIFVLRYELVKFIYETEFDREVFYTEIFTPWLPYLILNDNLWYLLTWIISDNNQDKINDCNIDSINIEFKHGIQKENNVKVHIKKNIHLIYSSVVTSNNLEDAQKDFIIKKLLKILSIEDSKIDMYSKSIWENKDWFIINVLYSIFGMLGIKKEYYFENLIARYNIYGEKYNIKIYRWIDTENDKEDVDDYKYSTFMSSIKYINSALCLNSSDQMSLEIKLWLIEMMGKMFPWYYDSWKTLEDKQDFFIRIYKFYQIANKHWSKSLFFGEGMIRYFLSSLKYCLDDQSLVEISLDTMTDSFELTKF